MIDKQKAIEEMAIKMGGCHFDSCVECRRQANCTHCFIFEQARILGENGYGNIEQALTAFAKKLKKHHLFYFRYLAVKEAIDETLKEFLINEKM